MGLGRKLIGNLTTITGSIDNFSVAILGFKWAHEYRKGLESTAQSRHREIREYFLRYEQLAAYLRHDTNAEILGISRVKERVSQGKPISLGMKTSEQILSNQASYGLWGLYSSACRASGLVSGADRAPAELGLQIVGLIESEMGPLASELKHAVTQEKPIELSQFDAWKDGFNTAIRAGSRSPNLFDALIAGPRDHLVQRQLWDDVQRWPSLANGDDGYEVLIDHLSQHASNEAIKNLATAIKETERILVTANQLFMLGRQNSGKTLDDIQALAEEHIGKPNLPSGLSRELTESQRDQLTPFFRAAIHHNWKEAFVHLVEVNERVMKDRDGAPWIRIEGHQKLSVRVSDETTRLIKAEELSTSWNYDYFLNSLLKIIRQTGNLAHG